MGWRSLPGSFLNVSTSVDFGNLRAGEGGGYSRVVEYCRPPFPTEIILPCPLGTRRRAHLLGATLNGPISPLGGSQRGQLVCERGGALPVDGDGSGGGEDNGNKGGLISQVIQSPTWNWDPAPDLMLPIRAIAPMRPWHEIHCLWSDPDDQEALGPPSTAAGIY